MVTLVPGVALVQSAICVRVDRQSRRYFTVVGALAALREFGDRIDGKPAQTLIGDNDEDPINVKTSGIIDLVRPTGS